MSMTHEITSITGGHKRRRRKGRGEGSGHGKTSGRGTKGAKARTGTYVKRGHEHGQTPIFRRFPKRGFSNENFERRYHIVNVSSLDKFQAGATVDQAALIEAGLVRDDRLPLKILGAGDLSLKLTIIADYFTQSALKKILDAGGTAQDPKGNAVSLAPAEEAADAAKSDEASE